MGYDWKPTTSAQVLANLDRAIRRNQRKNVGSNLLLHDGGQTWIGQDRSHSVEATRQLLERTVSTTRFVTIDAWG
jgi:peptidoglycan-N-acetylglucosamine deacetylase